jgi:hypothetical protein
MYYKSSNFFAACDDFMPSLTVWVPWLRRVKEPRALASGLGCDPAAMWGRLPTCGRLAIGLFLTHSDSGTLL